MKRFNPHESSRESKRRKVSQGFDKNEFPHEQDNYENFTTHDETHFGDMKMDEIDDLSVKTFQICDSKNRNFSIGMQNFTPKVV